MRRSVATVATLACTLVLTAACGDDGDGSTGTGDTKVINITFADGAVTPNGDRVEVDTGQPIELVVKAGEPGEIHVHSTPEKELPYGAGTTTLTLSIDTPGVVDVEAHDLDVTIVQLEVR
jgi:hypothetical protein